MIIRHCNILNYIDNLQIFNFACFSSIFLIFQSLLNLQPHIVQNSMLDVSGPKDCLKGEYSCRVPIDTNFNFTTRVEFRMII